MRHAADIETSRRHVRRDEDVDGIFLELANDGIALRLGQIAVNAFRRVPPLLEGFRHLVGAALRADEDDRQIGLLHIQQAAESVEFLQVRQLDIFLLDQIDGDRRRLDLHVLRLLQERVGELADRVGHGRREEHGLPLLRHG